MIGYLSASVEWAHNRGTPDAWREWWQNPDAGHYYFMGKDNIVFHSVIWPAMLLGYDGGGELGAGRGDLHLPTNVVASEYLTMEGKKASTSRNLAIWVADFLSRYDPDPLRYYLTAGGPETQDTDFTWEEFVRRNNDELLANWGNLVNRTLVSAHRNFGVVPEPGELTEADTRVLDGVAAAFDEVGEHIEGARFRAAIAAAMRASSLANQYVAEQQPWALVKTDRDRAATVLYVALRAVDSLKTLLAPFLPFTSQTVHELLGYDGWLAGPLEFRTATEEDGSTHEVLTGDYASWVGTWAPSELAPGQALREPKPLFRKLAARDGGGRARAARSVEDSVIDTHAHLDALDDDPARRRRARARRGRDADPHRRHRRRRLQARARARRAVRRRVRDPRHPSARGRHDDRRRRRARCASCSRTRAPSRWGRPASTGSATTRRPTRSSASSRRSSRSPPSCRSPS